MPNCIAALMQVMQNALGSKIIAKEKNASPTYKATKQDGIDILAMASRGEEIELVERPGTKVAIGLTKPRKPKVRQYSNIN